MAYHRKPPYINPRNNVGKKTAHVIVVPRNDRYVDRDIKKFLRKVKKNGILDEVRKRSYYEKPSVKRKRKARKREKVLRKLEATREQ